MPRFTIDRREGLTRDETPERIQAWLRNHGYPDAEVISTGWSPNNGNVRVIVESSADPAEAMQTYTPQLTPRERFAAVAIADAKVVIAAIAQKPRAERGPVERALLGMAVRLGEVAEGSE